MKVLRFEKNNSATKMHLYLSFVAPEMSLLSPLVSLLSNMFTNTVDARVEADIFIFLVVMHPKKNYEKVIDKNSKHKKLVVLIII